MFKYQFTVKELVLSEKSLYYLENVSRNKLARKSKLKFKCRFRSLNSSGIFHNITYGSGSLFSVTSNETFEVVV